MKKRGKKAIFFSTDVLIAIMIIFLSIVVILPLIKYSHHETELPQDLINVLSLLKTGEVNNSYVEELINQSKITDLNKSLLEQIGEFYVTNTTIAKNLAQSIISEMDIVENIGIWYGNTLVGYQNSSSYETAENVEVRKQIISGIREGESVTGFSARAFFSQDVRAEYFYFGGYVGEGNISSRIEFEGEVSSVEIELVANKDFNLYINGNYSGFYENSTSLFQPKNYDISDYISRFHSGENIIKFSGEDLNIGGGFIKIMYENSTSFEEKPTRYYFPGIEGLVNLYDGFYIPGVLNSMNIYLHLNTPYKSFLKIGNTTLFRNHTDGEEIITIDDSELVSMLNYSELVGKTIPLRLGMENVSYSVLGSGAADVFSVTDLSGSMDDDCSPRSCEYDCGACVGSCKICDAKSANDALIDAILNLSRNRIGLAGYETSVKDSDFHELSKDSDSLKNIVNNVWDASGNTCICCGINKAAIAFNYSVIDPISGTLSSRVSQGSDDAEERSSGTMESLSSSDLELVRESSIQQVGMRFQNINIPQGTNITSAYIEFETDERDSEETHLTFSAEDTDNAQTFTSSKNNISNRIKTSAKVAWSHVPSWVTRSEKHQTPDLSPVIQEVIDRGEWLSGNSIVIIVNGTGKRVAESYNGESSNAPLLVITYSNIPENCGNLVVDEGEECDDGNSNNNDNCTNMCTNAVCGEGIIWNQEDGDEECDDGNQNDDDGCSSSCKNETRYKSMIVMSDGQATRQCSEQGTGSSTQDAIQAACDAYNNYGITVHAVGFGSGADETTLQAIANCGNGSYYYGDVENIIEIYQQIAEDIIEASYTEQTIESSGEISTILYPDSYIEFNYTKTPLPYGLITSAEEMFSDSSFGYFDTPENSTILDVKVISYSGPRWTKEVEINNNSVYNLSGYGSDFIELGDPYSISVPLGLVNSSNVVKLITGLSAENSTEGSEYNKIIYEIVKDMNSYSSISSKAEGCEWTIEFEDDTNITKNIPSDYNGSNVCYYTSEQRTYDINDAIQTAVYNLLKLMDFDSNNKLNVKFTGQNLEISSSEITGIPYGWSTEVQVRMWY